MASSGHPRAAGLQQKMGVHWFPDLLKLLFFSVNCVVLLKDITSRFAPRAAQLRKKINSLSTQHTETARAAAALTQSALTLYCQHSTKLLGPMVGAGGPSAHPEPCLEQAPGSERGSGTRAKPLLHLAAAGIAPRPPLPWHRMGLRGGRRTRQSVISAICCGLGSRGLFSAPADSFGEWLPLSKRHPLPLGAVPNSCP